MAPVRITLVELDNQNELCRLCKKSFSSKSDLEKHEETHQKVLPCTFPDCEKRFSSANDLKSHAIDHILSKGNDKKELNESVKSKPVKKEIDKSLKLKQEKDMSMNVKEEKDKSIKIKEEKDTFARVKKERDMSKIKEEEDNLVTVKEEKDQSVKKEVKEEKDKSHLIERDTVKNTLEAVNKVDNKSDKCNTVNDKFQGKEVFNEVVKKVDDTNDNKGTEIKTNVDALRALQEEFKKNKLMESQKEDTKVLEQVESKVEVSENKKKDSTTSKGSVGENKSPRSVCDVCQKVLKTSVSLMVHMRIHTGEKPYSCEQCGKSFRQCASFKYHKLRCLVKPSSTQAEESPSNGMEQETNEASLEKDNLVETNSSNENEKNSLICKTCNKRLSTAGSLQVHKRIHTGEKPFACDHCTKSFRQYILLKRHRKKDHNMPLANKVEKGENNENEYKFACKTCDKHLSTSATLMQHMRIHTGERPYSCEHCTATFRQQPSLYFHNSKHHGISIRKRKYERKKGKWDERLLECKICNLNFETRKDFKDHITIHQVEKVSIDYSYKEKPFLCDFDDCSHRSRTAQSIKIHNMVHTGIRPYACKMCPFRAIMRTHLEVHERSHTGERPNKCKFCGRGFNALCALIVHERIHTGEKPFQCDLCPRKFRKRWNMKTHRISHTGEKPYPCDKCSMTFTLKSSMRGHQRRADGNGPYSCHDCDMLFCNNYEMKSHYRKVHFPEAFQIESERPRKSRDKTISECNICDESFPSRYDMKEHKASVHKVEKPDNYPCHKCSLTFKRSDTRRLHMERLGEGGPYSCFVCAMVFCFNLDLTKHCSKMHSGDKPYPCDKCSMTFRRSETQKDHKKRPTESGPLSCPVCAKLFCFRRDLSMHRRLTHYVQNTDMLEESEGQRKTGSKFECLRCYKEFSQLKNLFHHESSGRCTGNPFKPLNNKNKVTNPTVEDKQNEVNLNNEISDDNTKDTEKYKDDLQKRKKSFNETESEERKRSRMVNSENNQLGSAADRFQPDVNDVLEDNNDGEEEFFDALRNVEKELEIEREIEKYSMLQEIDKIPEQAVPKTKSFIEVLQENINSNIPIMGIPNFNYKAPNSAQNEIDLEIEKYSDQNQPNFKSMNNNVSKNRKQLNKGRDKIDSNVNADIVNVYEEIRIDDEDNLLNKFAKFVKQESSEESVPSMGVDDGNKGQDPKVDIGEGNSEKSKNVLKKPRKLKKRVKYSCDNCGKPFQFLLNFMKHKKRGGCNIYLQKQIKQKTADQIMSNSQESNGKMQNQIIKHDFTIKPSSSTLATENICRIQKAVSYYDEKMQQTPANDSTMQHISRIDPSIQQISKNDIQVAYHNEFDGKDKEISTLNTKLTYSCELCSKTFSFPAAFKKHKRISHGG